MLQLEQGKNKFPSWRGTSSAEQDQQGAIDLQSEEGDQDLDGVRAEVDPARRPGDVVKLALSFCIAKDFIAVSRVSREWSACAQPKLIISQRAGCQSIYRHSATISDPILYQEKKDARCHLGGPNLRDLHMRKKVYNL